VEFKKSPSSDARRRRICHHNDERGSVMLRSHTDPEAVVIGIFPRASDARRALNVLREHHFSAEEAAAAFRDPAPARVATEQASVPVRGSANWFGQLRQIYHGDDRIENTQPGGAAQAGFGAMLSQLDLSSQDALVLKSDLDRGAAIITVTAGVRNPEARALLEQYGARIVHSHNQRGPAIAASEPATVVTSTPFNPPQEAEPGHIQLFGEVLRVRKEKVASGEVHVRKESVTRMETVQVPVTREHLVVERSDENGRTAPENSIQVPLSEERVHIDKDTVLREEYKVGKREVTQNESISDRVRRERLLIDDASARQSNQSSTD
jgi:uncharacterized protein (TIGR02271 family)